MDIELPNGVVIQDVPEGATKAQIMQKAISSGLAKPSDFGVQEQPQRSLGEELLRQAGLTGRAAYEGFTAPATTVLEGLRSAYNLGAGAIGSESRLPSVAQAQSKMLTRAGLPEAETGLERAVQAGTQAMTGTGTMAAMAPKVPALASNLVQQIPASAAGGMAAQPTAELTKEATSGVLGEFGSDIAAMLASFGVGAKVGAKAGEVAGRMAEAKQPLLTMDEVRQRASKSYQAMDQANVYIKPKSVLDMVDKMENNLGAAQFIPQNEPKIVNTLAKMRQIVGGNYVSFSKLEELRKMANILRNDKDGNTSRLGNVMVDTVDDYIGKINGRDVFAAKGKLDEAVKSVMSARKDWRNQSRAEVLDDALNVAEAKALDPKASESELIRRGFINIAANKSKMNRFSEEEQNVIKSVAKGGSLDPILSLVGSFSPFRSKLATGATIATTAASPLAGAGLATLGYGADVMQSALRRRAAELATKQIASGAAPRTLPRTGYSGLLGSILSREEEPTRIELTNMAPGR